MVRTADVKAGVRMGLASNDTDTDGFYFTVPSCTWSVREDTAGSAHRFTPPSTGVAGSDSNPAAPSRDGMAIFW